MVCFKAVSLSPASTGLCFLSLCCPQMPSVPPCSDLWQPPQPLWYQQIQWYLWGSPPWLPRTFAQSLIPTCPRSPVPPNTPTASPKHAAPCLSALHLCTHTSPQRCIPITPKAFPDPPRPRGRSPRRRDIRATPRRTTRITRSPFLSTTPPWHPPLLPAAPRSSCSTTPTASPPPPCGSAALRGIAFPRIAPTPPTNPRTHTHTLPPHGSTFPRIPHNHRIPPAPREHRTAAPSARPPHPRVITSHPHCTPAPSTPSRPSYPNPFPPTPGPHPGASPLPALPLPPHPPEAQSGRVGRIQTPAPQSAGGGSAALHQPGRLRNGAGPDGLGEPRGGRGPLLPPGAQVSRVGGGGAQRAPHREGVGVLPAKFGRGATETGDAHPAGMRRHRPPEAATRRESPPPRRPPPPRSPSPSRAAPPVRLHRPRCALRSGGASPERQRSRDLTVRRLKGGWEEIPPLRQNVGLCVCVWGGGLTFSWGEKLKIGNFCGCCKTAGCGVLAAGCNGVSAKEPFALKVFREYPPSGSGVLVCIRETLNSIKLISAFRSCGSVQKWGRTAPSLGIKEGAKEQSRKELVKFQSQPP